MSRRAERLAGVSLLLCLLLVPAASARAGGPPAPEGEGGRLPPCPDRPNCVSSQAAEGSPRRIEPLRFSGPPEAAWRRLAEAVRSMGGAIVAERAGYLHATFTSRLFRFVDDLECRMDAAAGLVHVRSASRSGYWDLGVNRRRVEGLRERFAAWHAGQ